MITIIFGHPLEDSLSGATRDALVGHLNASKQPYHVIDLYKDGFDPAMAPEERRTFFTTTGESNDPLVRQYQNKLKETDHLVFIFPIWFDEQPAIISGFFERTCLPGFAYAYTEKGTVPLLTQVKKVTVITSSGAATEALAGPLGNMIENHFIKHIVYNMTGPMTGDEGMAWINLGNASQEGLSGHIDRIKARF